MCGMSWFWYGSEINARPLFGPMFTFTPQFKCLFSCNNKPNLKNVKDEDFSVWRRIFNLCFESTFIDDVEDDPEHHIYKTHKYDKEYLKSLRNPLMNILLKYYVEYKKHGLVQLNKMKLLDQEYKKSTNSISKWFDDHIEITNELTNDGLPFKVIWTSFSNNKIYYQKGILMKDLKQYLDQYECVDKKRFNDGLSPHNKVYIQLKWIDEKPTEKIPNQLDD